MTIVSSGAFDGSAMAVLVGSFEGLHIGHQAAIRMLGACKEKLRAVIIEYAGQPVLYTRHEIPALLTESGLSNYIDYLVFVPGAHVTHSSPCVYPAAETVLDNGSPVCAARIRTALASGDMQTAARLLGRPFALNGRVVHGKSLGRGVGMPTANLSVPADKFLPRYGVYETETVLDGVPIRGLTNIGPRPSVDENPSISIETHFIHFSGDLYGRELNIGLRRYVRDIKKFAAIGDVKKQVERDIAFIEQL